MDKLKSEKIRLITDQVSECFARYRKYLMNMNQSNLDLFSSAKNVLYYMLEELI